MKAGEAAVQLTFSLSESIGLVTGVEGGESGLQIASPEDLACTDMASDEEAPHAIAMASEGLPAALVWLNTLEAQAGSFEISLIGVEGTCRAEITFEGDGA